VIESTSPRAKYVIGPDGSPLTIADLPSSATKRWPTRRKGNVVAAVCGGLVSVEEACSRYALTVEEFRSWQYLYDRYGLSGLRATRIQQYRPNGFSRIQSSSATPTPTWRTFAGLWHR